jgi:hypothetical protein
MNYGEQTLSCAALVKRFFDIAVEGRKVFCRIRLDLLSLYLLCD